MSKCLSVNIETNITIYYEISKYITVISQAYQSYHPVVTLILIIFGVSLGILNLIILNFKKMVSPTNRMLSCIGVIDMVTMCSYAPYVIYFHIFNKCDLIDGTEAMLPTQLLYSYIVVTAVSHGASIWLAIGLSALRLHCMRNPQQIETATWKQMYIITVTVIAMSCSMSIIYVINTTIDITTIPIPSHNNLSVQRFALNQSGMFLIIFHGIIVKLLPSVLLTVMVIFIIKEFRSFINRRKNLGKSSNMSNTTRMLIGIVILFIFLELPQGIIIFISALSLTFFREIYNGLGDIVDLMTIVRTVANFFIYCSMSAMFRRYLVEILCKLCTCCKPNTTEPAQQTPLTGETLSPVTITNKRLRLTHPNTEDTESEPEYYRMKDIVTLLPVTTEAII